MSFGTERRNELVDSGVFVNILKSDNRLMASYDDLFNDRSNMDLALKMFTEKQNRRSNYLTGDHVYATEICYTGGRIFISSIHGLVHQQLIGY